MRRPVMWCVFSALVGALVAVSLTSQDRPAQLAAQEPGAAGQAMLRRTPPIAAQALDEASDTHLTAEERVNIVVYETVNRSVVNIETESVSTDRFFFFEAPSKGAGSGSVIDKQGHILTNYHVIEGARQIQVTLFDGKSYDARLVGRDPTSDVAVIRIDAPAESLYPVRFGDSVHLKVGQRVFAIGNPFGLERTLTTGIVSSLNRDLPGRNGRTMKSIIQTDAAINPGNSGGPLLDSRGRLIGMNTAIASRTGQNTGVGFAIPVAMLTRVVPQLVEKGRVIRPEPGIARVYETDRGLLIAALVPGGPAEQAGLRGFRLVRKRQGPFEIQSVDRSAADLLVAIDGQKITKAGEFLDVIDSHQPGDEVMVTVIREGREVPVRIQLAAAEE